MTRKKELSAIIGALIVVVVGVGAFYFVSTRFETAPNPSVSNKEGRNEQPAGPANPAALPGNQ
ncbi:hypothetical protein [Rhizobium glycinendophyticum]|uniref:Uncharacterized protein n=1 Tax=Rhizobium glycinendophyticum TaxID=2589807 RepID=A0A504UGI4_9HYPH|nr:hypothetical protein [Rhizobium glycinendophyticum]TPP05971.1 hypothetical protein FJQ55_19745 [Rhizobium glycinendophyticum]